MTHDESGEQRYQTPTLNCGKCGAVRSDWTPLCPGCGNPLLTKQDAELNAFNKLNAEWRYLQQLVTTDKLQQRSGHRNLTSRKNRRFCLSISEILPP